MAIQFEVQCIESDDYLNWDDFVQHQVSDPLDAYGWFTVTIGEVGDEAGSYFSVCVATPRAVGRLKVMGYRPGILVDHYDAESVERAIVERVASIKGHHYMDLVDQLRGIMQWEYEGM